MLFRAWHAKTHQFGSPCFSVKFLWIENSVAISFYCFSWVWLFMKLRWYVNCNSVPDVTLRNWQILNLQFSERKTISGTFENPSKTINSQINTKFLDKIIENIFEIWRIATSRIFWMWQIFKLWRGFTITIE